MTFASTLQRYSNPLNIGFDVGLIFNRKVWDLDIYANETNMTQKASDSLNTIPAFVAGLGTMGVLALLAIGYVLIKK